MDQLLVTGLASTLAALVAWVAAREVGRNDRTANRQSNAAVDLGKIETRLTAVERQQEEHGQLALIVAELKTEVRNLRADMRDMGLTLREILIGNAKRA